MFVSKKLTYQSCSEEMTETYVEIDNLNPMVPWQNYKKEKSIRRKCSSDQEYTPLKLRTKTLEDLKKDDLSKRREVVDTYSQKYENKRIDN